MFMKRRDVIKRIGKAAKAARSEWGIEAEGGNHTKYSLDGLMVPFPATTRSVRA